MARTPEAIEKAKVRKFLNSLSVWHIWPVPTGYGRNGLDCYACVNSWFCAIEVKAPGKKPTERQQAEIKLIHRAGGFALAGTGDEIIHALKCGPLYHVLLPRK